ncbi:hypothetical protein ACFSJU_07620 [Paradesertivirga mongoliensis]|uniref:LTXXQ motif family protein n=1 Tax=Paradesertivirga mongoliensis TaxID=2100740 RepID=A0ABW4ZK57_9SPHI|nr:hypothetical protein [Pedobacter mongoliensis]
MKPLYLILLMTGFGLSGSAQQPQKPSKEERLNNISKTLLVDKQKAEEIVAALDYNVEKIRSTARDTNLKGPAKQELMKKLHEERQAKIKATLTQEQLSAMHAKIASIIADRKAKAEAHRAERAKKLEKKEKEQKELNRDKKP